MKVRCTSRPASTRFGADLTLDHLDMPCPPQARQLVVRQQVLRQLPQIVKVRPVPGHADQRGKNLLVVAYRQATGLQQIDVGVPERRFGKPSGQALALGLGGCLEPGDELGILGARKKLKLPELNRLEAACRCQRRSELEEV